MFETTKGAHTLAEILTMRADVAIALTRGRQSMFERSAANLPATGGGSGDGSYVDAQGYRHTPITSLDQLRSTLSGGL